MTPVDTLWLTNPALAYADWQRREAAGADRRPFAARSIIQHQAMFEHFRRHLLDADTTVATFGPDHIDTFWQAPDARGYSTATRMRYLKLLDRLCRHLVAIGVRKSNPAGQLVRDGHWPKAEPDPIYLPEDADARLQAWGQPHAGDDPAALRNRAIVALFLGTGVTRPAGRTSSPMLPRPTCACPPTARVIPARSTSPRSRFQS
jgi:site-specific recombinase XerD